MPLKKCKREDKKSVEHLQGIFTTYTALRRASMFVGGCGLVRRGQKKECGDEIIVTHTQEFQIGKNLGKYGLCT